MITMTDYYKNSGIKRILILGHSGFIGSHLERFFHKNCPDIELVGKSLPTLDLTNEEDVLYLKNFFDISTAIILCAAIKPNFGDNIDNFSQNVQMIMNVCKLLEKHPVRRLVYFSSASVYGEDIENTNINEQTPVHPTSYYGMAKFAAERLLWKTFEKQGQKQSSQHNQNSQSKQNTKGSLVIIRPPAIYGSGETVPTYNPTGFVKAALNNEQITLWGDGTEKREFLFIDDIVKIVYELAFNNYSGILNPASGKSYSFKQAIDIISKLTNKKLMIASRERTKNKVDNCFNNKLFLKLLPGFSFTTLEQGIRQVLEEEKLIEGKLRE